MGGRTITWTGSITPDEVGELAREILVNSDDLSLSVLYLSETACQELLDHPGVRNTFIWMEPKSLAEGYFTLYGLRITVYQEPDANL